MTVGIVVLALLASTLLGILLVPAALRLAPAKGLPRAKAAELLRGGLVIGVLERLAITGGLLAGRPEVIGVVLAIKGLGRYPELRNAATAASAEGTSTAASAEATAGAADIAPDGAASAATPASAASADRKPGPDIGAAVSERFIIGTLASYIWAGICGIVGLWLLARVG